jgi:hypothetical protein
MEERGPERRWNPWLTFVKQKREEREERRHADMR